MRDFLFVAATVLYGVAIVVAYLNRNSEKVLTTLFLGVAALIGALIAVAVFSTDRSSRAAFSVPIIIHGDTRLPVEGGPYPALPMGLAIEVREKLTEHPELLPDIQSDSFARTLYHHALQRAIVYWLQSKYISTWQTDVYPASFGESSGYMFQQRPVPSHAYTALELQELMKGNLFADIRGPFAGQFGLAVPPGMNLIISVPHMEPDQGEVARLQMKNRFCTLSITSRPTTGMVGAGSYRLIYGMSQDQAQQAFKSDQYTVVIEAHFNPLLAGNPQMPLYRDWARNITDGLREQFSDEVIWPKTRDWLLFHKVAGN